MNVPKTTKLHPLAKSALQEIATARDVTPEMVLWVQEAACRISKFPSRPAADLIDWPIPVGGVMLRPLSFGAAEWLSKLPPKFRDDVKFIAFACCHSNKLSILEELTDVSCAIKTVGKWVKKLSCSIRALESIVDRLLHCNENRLLDDIFECNSKSNHWDYGAVIRTLCSKYPGTTPDHWLWDVSREKACAMLYDATHGIDSSDQVTEYEDQTFREFRTIIAHLKNGGSDE